MKRLFAVTAVVALLLVGCGGNQTQDETTRQEMSSQQTEKQTEKQTEEQATIADAKSLADELLANVTFDDELADIDIDTAKFLYQIDTCVDAFVYISSGATAEEIAVFAFADSQSAKEALPIAEKRIADQKEGFASYVPEEVQRLDNAVVAQCGNYVVVCVSEGDAAEKIIKKYTK